MECDVRRKHSAGTTLSRMSDVRRKRSAGTLLSQMSNVHRKRSHVPPTDKKCD